MTSTNRRRARPANGIVLWEGESLYDGAPIAIIVTGLISPSRNTKVGPSMQAAETVALSLSCTSSRSLHPDQINNTQPSKAG